MPAPPLQPTPGGPSFGWPRAGTRSFGRARKFGLPRGFVQAQTSVCGTPPSTTSDTRHEPQLCPTPFTLHPVCAPPCAALRWLGITLAASLSAATAQALPGTLRLTVLDQYSAYIGTANGSSLTFLGSDFVSGDAENYALNAPSGA